ncbi:FAD-binding oxidoreductase [Thioclava litoralis]|uniref:FAD-binding oxidoreductase n=1 Tax=Thioclava litoralis TaxID=3076557 RepID=A0ABZ1E408_9RHOB|nr:FAD-binding oxidoreductase [Thioclava sp. FTW29]
MTSGLRINRVGALGDQVTVRGAGVFGLACAFEMARRGASVRVIDIKGIGAGASGGTVGALAPHVPENWNPKKQFQLESLLMAADFWADVARIGGGDAGYGRIGRVQPLQDAAQIARAQTRGENAKTLWQGQAVWEVVPARRFGPLGFHSPSGYVVQDTLSARACPRAAGDALARAIRALGGEILIGAADETGPVLHATGTAGLSELGTALGKSLGAGIKGQAAVFAFDAGDMPQIYAESLHIIPHSNGTVAIGSTSERDYSDPESTDAQLETLIEKTRRICPELAAAPVIDRWAGLRPRAKSRAPMLGPWPDRAGHFIANGGFKIGFGMAPKVAQVMADMILEGRADIPQGFHVEDSF